MAYSKQKQSNAFSYGDFVWWTGVIEDRMDPEKLGRVRVRVFGYHSDDKSKISTEQLMWAYPMMPFSSAALSGLGRSPTGPVEGTHVIGFFMDGDNAQMPVIMGTVGGKPSKKDAGKGFFDPKGKYPKYPLGEPDTNRLARNEKINETCVQKRRQDEDKGVVSAFGVSWSEKTTPYNAKYPFNHVYESESGHVEEFDDTEGKERYLLWHRTGSFQEIHNEGSKVTKVKKDNYEIVYGNDYVHIKGNCTVTIDGDSHVKVGGNANIEINGNCKETIHGNYSLAVDGNYDIQVNGHMYANSDTHMKLTCYNRIDLNP